MTDALLLTKLYVPPPRPDLVFRPRLVERLNEGLALGRKLTLISAPAGFGKTTLVSEWVAEPQKRAPGQTPKTAVAWLSLDDADNDLARFISYLVAALRTIHAGLGEGVLATLRSTQPLQVESLLTELLNEISALPTHFVLILDDFHAIDSQPVDRSLEFLVEHLPPQMHLVITTREDPPLPLARYRARCQLTELRASDLRFTAGEAAELLNQVTGLRLSDENIAALETRTEGWIAGLQLAAISMQGHKDAAGFIQSFTGSHRFVMDYLLEEVLQQQPANIQAFLLRTSILERMCGPLCDALLKDPSVPGQSTLETLEHSNLFIVPLDNERKWYRYHHLFGDLLHKRLEQNLNSENRADLHLKASRWYEEEGLLLESFKHAAASGDLERTREIMEHKAMPLNHPGVPKTILNWLESLPESVLNANPGLWWKQAAMMMSNYQTIGVEEKLLATEAALALRNPPGTELDDWARNLVGKIAVARAVLAQTYYQADASLIQARRALEYLHPNNIAYRSGATQIIGFAQYLKGDRDAAQQSYTESLELAKAAGDSDAEVMAIIRLAQIHEIKNKLHEAHETYERALHLLGDNPPPYASVAFLGLARIHYEWNDLENARNYGERGHQLALRNLEVIDRLITTEMFFGRLSLAQADPQGAIHHLEEAEKQARRMDFVLRLPHIAGEHALVELYQGNIEAATQLAQECECKVTRARVLLAQGDASAALGLLVPFIKAAEADKDAETRLQAIVVQALAHEALGEHDAAQRILTDAVTLAEPGGFIRLFVDLGEPMRALLHALRSNQDSESSLSPAQQGYITRILSIFSADVNSQERGTLPTDETLLDVLSPRELEVLRLVCQGCSNQEIGARLFLALDTVKGHNRRIFEKLQVHSRTEAIARAHELNLV